MHVQDELRRHPRPDAQLRGPGARQPRRGAQRAARRESARGRAAGPGTRCARSRRAAMRQAVLPPHERPYVPALRALGFDGTDADVIESAARAAPRLLAACSSAAAMWVANAATVSASADTQDGRVHFTPANLVSHFHRSIEAETTTRVLRAIFADAARFVVHDPLPAAPQLGDEGAANHTRFVAATARGVDFFVYGRAALASRRDRRRRASRRGRRGKRARRSLAGTALRAATHGLRAAIAGSDRRRRVPQRRHRRGRRAAAVLSRARLRRSGSACSRALRRAVGDAFSRDRRRRSRRHARRRRAAATCSTASCLPRDDGRWLLLAPADVREHPRVSALRRPPRRVRRADRRGA